MVDDFDPNILFSCLPERRIYADDYANDYAIVDEIDYQYLIQWRWKLSISKRSRGAKKRKAYLARAVPRIVGKDEYIDGKRIQNRVTSTVYLHQVVMERKGDQRPKTNKKLIIDHADGDGFNCRRKNLRWATIAFNNMNINGSHERVLFGDMI